MIQLICMDVDGTLLNENLALTAPTIQALQRANARGLKIVLATGRGFPSTLPILKQLNLGCAVINSAGAQIRIPGHQTINNGFTPQQARQIFDLAMSRHSGMFIDQPERDLRFGNPDFIKMYEHVNFSTFAKDENDVLEPTPNKFSIINEPDVLHSIRQELLANNSKFYMAAPFKRVLDITPPETTKGNALVNLCKLLNIPIHHTAAIGDSENDVSMLEIAGLSIAMGNAPPAIQKAADWTAPPNSQDGAAWAINRIMDNRFSE